MSLCFPICKVSVFFLSLTTFKSLFIWSAVCDHEMPTAVCACVHRRTHTHILSCLILPIWIYVLMSFTHFGKSLVVMSSNIFSASFFFRFSRTSVTYILDCLILSYRSQIYLLKLLFSLWFGYFLFSYIQVHCCFFPLWCPVCLFQLYFSFIDFSIKFFWIASVC